MTIGHDIEISEHDHQCHDHVNLIVLSNFLMSYQKFSKGQFKTTC